MSCTDSHVSNNISEKYIPECLGHLKLVVGRIFKTLEDCAQLYRLYAAACGFDVRLGPIKKASDGTVVWRYIYCNRQGVNTCLIQPLQIDGKDDYAKRRKLSRRNHCMARIDFRFDALHGYAVNSFVEGDSHVLVSDRYKNFMKFNRNIDVGHQSFLLNYVKSNIGPMRSFRLFKELVGSYDNIGCTIVDFKNFFHDLRAFAVGVHAQILIYKLYSKRELWKEFTFDYSVDQDGRLTRLFWADPISIKNYQIFGQNVSFDATYSTNKYKMIFAPFTGKKNHGGCVTFASSIISGEDVDSYIWVFKKFIKCMGKSPDLIITDQDPAMKIAIERVLPGTRYRFCMWHIMLKVADKIPVRLREDENFKKRFSHVVWSEIMEPNTFEAEWNDILCEFGISSDSWFVTMFELRKFWIPAYFRDFPLGGIFQTTSISESENSFFRKYFRCGSNLIEFLINFETAMDAQRHTFDHNNSVDESCFLILKTSFDFEKYAASIYTIKIFQDIQEEIVAARDICVVTNIINKTDCTIYEVDDFVDGKFKVSHDQDAETIVCECKYFTRYGLLCRHVFTIFRNLKLKEIPAKYITPRWCKHACKDVLQTGDTSMTAELTDSKLTLIQLHLQFHSCVGMVHGNVGLQKEMLAQILEFKERIRPIANVSSCNSVKSNTFEEFYGSSIPPEIHVHPPQPVKTKGSGSRLKSRKEKALRMKDKPLRRCKKYNQMARHDSRNCDKNTTAAETN